MKRFVLPFLLVVLPFMGLTQNAQQKNGFGINQDFHDYNVKLLDNKITSFDSSLSQSLRISYNRYLGKSWALSVGLTNGFLLNQTEENKLIRKSYLFGGDVDLMLTLNNGRFFPIESRVAPYLSFGYNFNYLDAYKDLGITPMVISNEYGFGAYIRLGVKSKLQIGAALNQQLNGDFDTHMQYRLGFAQSIGKQSKQPVVPPKNQDYDNDGIVDADDDCPTLAGIADNKGCPEAYVGNDIMNDSVFSLIEDLEQSLLKLKSDLYNIQNNQVIEVVYTPGNEEIVQTNKSDVTDTDGESTDQEKESKTASNKDKEDPISEDTDKVVAQKENKSGPDKKTEAVVKKDTDQTETPKSGISQADPGKPMVSYKTGADEKAYYVIAISTKDKELAERSAALIANDFQKVKILPQPNGFYRVGIYATRTKTEALKILDYAKHHGVPSGWIAFE